MPQTWGAVARTNIANKDQKKKMEKGEGMKNALFLKVPNYTNTILICVSTLCGGSGVGGGLPRIETVPPFIKCVLEHTLLLISALSLKSLPPKVTTSSASQWLFPPRHFFAPFPGS